MYHSQLNLYCVCRRPAYQYEAERIEGAVNIPTFRPVAGKGKWDVLKKIAMGALAMKATGQSPRSLFIALTMSACLNVARQSKKCEIPAAE